ncbi:PDZ domain (Also known as DHR or GLGF) domain-containing protein [Phthorimaea operculella]|nr:PDZ domain (Also known as DHR or GLGF) domain-containing protein [Phthorimaea operculella]
MNKIRKKYANLGDTVLSVKLERSPTAGLGLSLAGHRDRSRMAVFICGLNPAGAAAKAQPPVKVGDEILEVNGIVLHGRCHLNASAIIKGLMGPVFKIILLRRKAALEDVAVKPITQFPISLEETSEDRFSGYKGVRDLTIKKGPSGLGIMIIEGRHTEAGRGIFVSDLQEGSAAEQAGLQIGDMILAVNRDSLLTCSYDAAAAKLKHTEGVVILTVCSPNAKDDKTENAGSSAVPVATGGASRPASRNEIDPKTGASRPTTPRPAASPAKVEPPPDPATCQLIPNKDTVIEITPSSEILGLVLLGGSDTLINGATCIILDIHKNGAIAKDGRLKVGDQIIDCNGIAITKEMAHERRCLTIKQKTPKLVWHSVPPTVLASPQFITPPFTSSQFDINNVFNTKTTKDSSPNEESAPLAPIKKTIKNIWLSAAATRATTQSTRLTAPGHQLVWHSVPPTVLASPQFITPPFTSSQFDINNVFNTKTTKDSSPNENRPRWPQSRKQSKYMAIGSRDASDDSNFPRPSLSSLTSSSKCSAWTTLTNEHRAAFRSAGERTGVKFRSA